MQYYLSEELTAKVNSLRAEAKEKCGQLETTGTALRYLMLVKTPHAGAVEETLRAAGELMENLAREYNSLAREISHYRLYDKEEAADESV